jgi:hypothetical protein
MIAKQVATHFDRMIDPSDDTGLNNETAMLAY